MIERLEHRTLLSSTAPFSLSKGLLRIDGTPGDDVITVGEEKGVVTSAVAGGRPTVRVLEHFLVVGVNALQGFRFDAREVRRVLIQAGDGNDTVTISTVGAGTFRPATIHGGAGDDIITGGQERNLIFGDKGNDRLFGGGGNDRIFGGAGDDTLDGGPGRDRVSQEGGRRSQRLGR